MWCVPTESKAFLRLYEKNPDKASKSFGVSLLKPPVRAHAVFYSIGCGARSSQVLGTSAGSAAANGVLRRFHVIVAPKITTVTGAAKSNKEEPGCEIGASITQPYRRVEAPIAAAATFRSISSTFLVLVIVFSRVGGCRRVAVLVGCGF